MDDGRHFANVKVHADIERFACLFFIRTVIQTSIELVIDGAAGQVGEAPPQIRLNQFRRVGIHQRRNVIRGQVLRVVERAGLNQTVQGRELWLFTYCLHELLVNEFKPFRRGCDVNTVTQPINFVTHTGDDFSPCLLRFGSRHDIQLIHHRVTDFETNYRAGLLHRAANCRAAEPSSLVEVNLFVSLIDFDAQPPVKGHLFDRRVEDVTNLRVRRREITLVDFWVFPHPFADAATTHPRFTGTEPGNVGFKLVLHREEASLWDVKCRADPHLLPSHPLR